MEGPGWGKGKEEKREGWKWKAGGRRRTGESGLAKEGKSDCRSQSSVAVHFSYGVLVVLALYWNQCE